MNDRPDKSAPNRLYVEGADDFHVLCALVRKTGVGWTRADLRIPYAPETNGDKNAVKQARTAVKARSHRCVGLVVDADSEPRSRWTEIRNELAEFAASPFGLELPETYPVEGVVARGQDGRRVGVWMMPGGARSGAVEGFLTSLVPQDDLWVHAVDATTAARSRGATFADKDLSKARLRAWLAWQKAPGAPYGRAIDAGFLASTSAEADLLVRWFRELFLAPDG